MSNLTLKGACLAAALLVSGALAGASPAAAQNVHVDVGVTAVGGDDDDGYDRPRSSRRHRDSADYHRSYDDDWTERYRSVKVRPYRRYRPAYAYAGPRCVTKVIRYYDEFEDASVTKRIRRCR